MSKLFKTQTHIQTWRFLLLKRVIWFWIHHGYDAIKWMLSCCFSCFPTCLCQMFWQYCQVWWWIRLAPVSLNFMKSVLDLPVKPIPRCPDFINVALLNSVKFPIISLSICWQNLLIAHSVDWGATHHHEMTQMIYTFFMRDDSLTVAHRQP